MSIEAMKMALEALESENPDIQLRAAISLRQAIAASEKVEPVAYRCWNNPQNADGTFDILRIWVSTKPEGYGNEPLYTAPPVASNNTSQNRVDETAKQEHEPVIDKSAAIRIATALGWTPPRQPLSDEEIDRIWMPHTIIQASDRQRHAFARAIEAACTKGET